MSDESNINICEGSGESKIVSTDTLDTSQARVSRSISDNDVVTDEPGFSLDDGDSGYGSKTFATLSVDDVGGRNSPDRDGTETAINVRETAISDSINQLMNLKSIQQKVSDLIRSEEPVDVDFVQKNIAFATYLPGVKRIVIACVNPTAMTPVRAKLLSMDSKFREHAVLCVVSPLFSFDNEDI